MALCASCSRWDLPVEIPFHAAWQGNVIACNGTTPALADLRFYVSNPRLLDAEGEEHDVRFATEFEWENDAVAYIDLETGGGGCAGGTPEVYDRIVGVAREGAYRGLRFTVGVPFRLNHADLRTASPPLDRIEMHSQAISGYTFLRVGVTGADGEFRIRLGSEVCEGSIGYVTGCEFPGRIDVFLPDFVPGDNGVVVNLDGLLPDSGLDGVQLHCASPAQEACAASYAALGIDVRTGVANRQQRVFAVR